MTQKYEYEVSLNPKGDADADTAIDQLYAAVLDGPTLNVEVGQVQAEDGDEASSALTFLVSFKIIGDGNGEPGQTLRRINELEMVNSIESA